MEVPLHGRSGRRRFVLFYLLFLVILGLPIMTMEFAVDMQTTRAGALYQAPRKARSEVAHPRLLHSHRLLPADDVPTVAGWMLTTST